MGTVSVARKVGLRTGALGFLSTIICGCTLSRTNDCETRCAGRYDPLPVWSALIVHVPGPEKRIPTELGTGVAYSLIWQTPADPGSME